MVTVCWSPKGGSGTTVVAATLALLLAERHGGSLLVDLAGDAPAVLGLPDPPGQGAWDWLSTPTAGPQALARLVREGTAGVDLLPAGAGPPDVWRPGRAASLVDALAVERRPVVVDAGLLRPELHDAVARATCSLLVIRSCYLALRRAVAAPLRPSGVVLVREPGRALGRHDVEEVLGVPVVACVDLSPDVARAVDAGLLVSRLPRSLVRGLRRAA
jgi:MinD-like ATPase involved in chromosome partitioning or flagellar assembly